MVPLIPLKNHIFQLPNGHISLFMQVEVNCLVWVLDFKTITPLVPRPWKPTILGVTIFLLFPPSLFSRQPHNSFTGRPLRAPPTFPRSLASDFFFWSSTPLIMEATKTICTLWIPYSRSSIQKRLWLVADYVSMIERQAAQVRNVNINCSW